jgi:hypothetical protein
MDDLSFNDASNLEIDLTTSFDKAWRELDDWEKGEASSDLPDRWIRLECNGDLVDIGCVGLVGLCESAFGGELIEFVCPRCGQHHESLRFG